MRIPPINNGPPPEPKWDSPDEQWSCACCGSIFAWFLESMDENGFCKKCSTEFKEEG